MVRLRCWKGKVNLVDLLMHFKIIWKPSVKCKSFQNLRSRFFSTQRTIRSKRPAAISEMWHSRKFQLQTQKHCVVALRRRVYRAEQLAPICVEVWLVEITKYNFYWSSCLRWLHIFASVTMSVILVDFVEKVFFLFLLEFLLIRSRRSSD